MSDPNKPIPKKTKANEEEKGRSLEIFTSYFDEEKKKDVYQPNEATLKHLESFGCQNICLIGVMGEQRKGKSTLMHVLFYGVDKAHTSPETFTIGHSVDSCTKNIHIWSVPIRTKDPQTGEEVLVFLADSEGMGAVNSSDDRDAQLVATLISLSSLTIYNVMKGTIDETDILKLGDTARKAQDLLKKRDEGGDSNLNLDEQGPVNANALVIAQSWWVQRDWGNLSHKFPTDQEYFESQINFQPKSEHAGRMRRMIKQTFPNMKFIGVPDPKKHPNQDTKMVLKYRPDERNPKWNEKMNELVKSVLSKATPKVINGKPLNGFVFAQFIREIIRGLNAGAIPTQEEQYVQLSEARCSSYYMMALNQFLTELNDRTNIKKSVKMSDESSNDLISLPPHLLEKNLQEMVLRCEKEYKEKCQGEVEEKVKSYLLKLQSKMKEEVVKCKKNYASHVETKIGGKLFEMTKNFKDLSERDLQLFEERLKQREDDILVSFQTSCSAEDLNLHIDSHETSQTRQSKKDENMDDLEPYLRYQDEFSAEFIIKKVEDVTKEIEDEYINTVPSSEKFKSAWVEQINQSLSSEIHVNWSDWMSILAKNFEQKMKRESEFQESLLEKLKSTSFVRDDQKQIWVREIEKGKEEIENLGARIRAFEAEIQKKEQNKDLEIEIMMSPFKVELEQLRSENQDLQNELNKKEEEMKSKEDELKNGFNALEVKLAVQEQLREQKEKESEEKEDLVQQLKTEVMHLQSIKDQFDDMDLQNKHLKKLKEITEEENQKLRQDLKKEKEEYQLMFQEQQAQIGQIQEEYNQKAKKIQADTKILNAKLLKSQDEFKKLNNEKLKLTNFAMERERVISDLKVERDSIEKKTSLLIKELNEKLEKKEEENKNYREDVISKLKEAENRALTQQNVLREKHRSEIEELKKKFEDVQKEKAELNTKFQVLSAVQQTKSKDLNDDERKELNKLREEIKEKHTRFIHLQANYESQSKRLSEAGQQIQDLRNELYNLNRKEDQSSRQFQQAALRLSMGSSTSTSSTSTNSHTF